MHIPVVVLVVVLHVFFLRPKNSNNRYINALQSIDYVYDAASECYYSTFWAIFRSRIHIGEHLRDFIGPRISVFSLIKSSQVSFIDSRQNAANTHANKTNKS